MCKMPLRKVQNNAENMKIKKSSSVNNKEQVLISKHRHKEDK
jgi:hypothetical protein